MSAEVVTNNKLDGGIPHEVTFLQTYSGVGEYDLYFLAGQVQRCIAEAVQVPCRCIAQVVGVKNEKKRRKRDHVELGIQILCQNQEGADIIVATIPLPLFTMTVTNKLHELGFDKLSIESNVDTPKAPTDVHGKTSFDEPKSHGGFIAGTKEIFGKVKNFMVGTKAGVKTQTNNNEDSDGDSETDQQNSDNHIGENFAGYKKKRASAGGCADMQVSKHNPGAVGRKMKFISADEKRNTATDRVIFKHWEEWASAISSSLIDVREAQEELANHLKGFKKIAMSEGRDEESYRLIQFKYTSGANEMSFEGNFWFKLTTAKRQEVIVVNYKSKSVLLERAKKTNDPRTLQVNVESRPYNSTPLKNKNQRDKRAIKNQRGYH